MKSADKCLHMRFKGELVVNDGAKTVLRNNLRIKLISLFHTVTHIMTQVALIVLHTRWRPPADLWSVSRRIADLCLSVCLSILGNFMMRWQQCDSDVCGNDHMSSALWVGQQQQCLSNCWGFFFYFRHRNVIQQVVSLATTTSYIPGEMQGRVRAGRERVARCGSSRSSVVEVVGVASRQEACR